MHERSRGLGNVDYVHDSDWYCWYLEHRGDRGWSVEWRKYAFHIRSPPECFAVDSDGVGYGGNSGCRIDGVHAEQLHWCGVLCGDEWDFACWFGDQFVDGCD